MLDRSRLKQPIDSYSKFWLGAAALAMVAIMVAAVLGIGALDLGKTEYRAEFAQTAQLRPGDQVTVAGISVGEVDALKLAGDRVIVTFTVDDDIPVGPDSRAAIKLTTLLGSRYLELSPAGTGELDARTIALGNTTVPYNLQETLADATTTFDRVDADQIAASMATLSDSLSGVPEALPEALTNLRSLSAVVSERRDQLKTLLASTDSVTAMIGDQKANLGALVLQGRDLLGELTSRRAQVQRLFESATRLIDTLNRVLGDQPGLNDLLDSMRELTEMTVNNDALIRNIMQTLPITMRNIANATGSGTAVDVQLPAGILFDSWMCALSGRAKQFNLVEYFKDCE